MSCFGGAVGSWMVVWIVRKGSRPGGYPRPRRRAGSVTDRQCKAPRVDLGGFAFNPIRVVRLPSGGLGLINAKTAGPPLPGVPFCLFLGFVRSAGGIGDFDRLGQRGRGTLEKTVHPLAFSAGPFR